MVIDTPALLLLALALLTLPLNWLLSAVAAAAFHELCHYFALRLLGGQARGLRIGPGGAVLTVTALTPGREALCALAGPLGGLLLLSLGHHFPRLALCAAIQSAFNLLPLWPLDGGRLLKWVLSMFFRESTAQNLLKAGEITVCTALLAAAISLKLGYFPIFLAIGLILKALSRKTPCKLGRPGVQ